MVGFLRGRRDPCTAIHQEESQSDCGRMGGRHLSVGKGGVLGTCSEIRGVPVGDNPAGRWGPAEELKKETRQYETKL